VKVHHIAAELYDFDFPASTTISSCSAAVEELAKEHGFGQDEFA